MRVARSKFARIAESVMLLRITQEGCFSKPQKVAWKEHARLWRLMENIYALLDPENPSRKKRTNSSVACVMFSSPEQEHRSSFLHLLHRVKVRCGVWGWSPMRRGS